MVSYPRIFLTGFSGTGKSTVAELLAAKLGWQALDTDALIAAKAGKPVAAIFAGEGEARFRELEREAISRAASEKNAVIATGGGAIVDASTRRAMAGGLVIRLEAVTETILARLESAAGSAERPLLQGADPAARIRGLKCQREKFYALADMTFVTDGRPPEQVAGDIASALGVEDTWPLSHPERFSVPGDRDRSGLEDPVWIEASRRYPAYAGWGLLDNLGTLLRDAGIKDAAWIVSDANVLPRHGERALQSIRGAGLKAGAFAIPGSEASKRLETAATVYDWLVEQRAERGHAIVALGGGVVGDLAGFVAATYLRGMPLVMAPTSVLSMVDASIGGKVAVDHPRGKNLIGAFHQPLFVLDDISVLKTLPRQMIAEGYAEAIKHAFIRSPELLDILEAQTEALLHVDPLTTIDVIRRNIAIKASVVAQDEHDDDLRAILNYGHTIGHALEAVTGYSAILHGAADAIGMMAAAEIGRRSGITPQSVIDRQRSVLQRFGLPTKPPAGIDEAEVMAAISLDKKVVGGVVRWVLLEDIARPIVRSDIPLDTVRAVVHGLLS